MKQRLLLFLFSIWVIVPLSSAQADRLGEMISPVSNPVNFEDPRINTEIRPVFMYHEIDDNFITGGGDVQLYALQARFAVSDEVAIIATKDGFIDFNPDGTLSDETGWANISGGVKWAFYQDAQEGQIATLGLRYEAPWGDEEVFMGEGDGQFNPFLSGAVALGDWNLTVGTGFRLPVDSDDSSFYDFDLQLDTNLDGFYPALGLNVVHVLDGGKRLAIADEGVDLFNFGASGADGKTVVTAAVGGRYRWDEDLDFGLSYQFPLTNGAGSNLFDYRITADMIVSFEV